MYICLCIRTILTTDKVNGLQRLTGCMYRETKKGKFKYKSTGLIAPPWRAYEKFSSYCLKAVEEYDEKFGMQKEEDAYYRGENTHLLQAAFD